MGARELDTKRLDLARAIEDVDMPMVCDMLEAGGIDLNEEFDGKTFLMMAVEYGTDEMVKALLDAGANPSQGNFYKATPLHLSAQMGVSGKIRLLVKAGADVDAQDVSGETPLYKAARYKRSDDVKRLMDIGADSTLKDNEGRTAADALEDVHASLREAIRHNAVPPLCNPREALNADMLTRKDDNGLSALDAGATWIRAEEVLAQLEASNSHLTRDVLMQEGKGNKTPMQRAVENGAGKAVLQHLYAHGESLEPEDLVVERKPTPLLNAVINKGAVSALFAKQAWQGRSAEQMNTLYRAMPEKGKEQVKNYFSLHTELTREEQARSQAGVGR